MSLQNNLRKRWNDYEGTRKEYAIALLLFLRRRCGNPICGRTASSIMLPARVKKITQVLPTGGSFFFLSMCTALNSRMPLFEQAVLLALVPSETLSAFLKRRLRVPGLVKYSRGIRKSSWQHTIKFASKSYEISLFINSPWKRVWNKLAL